MKLLQHILFLPFGVGPYTAFSLRPIFPFTPLHKYEITLICFPSHLFLNEKVNCQMNEKNVKHHVFRYTSIISLLVTFMPLLSEKHIVSLLHTNLTWPVKRTKPKYFFFLQLIFLKTCFLWFWFHFHQSQHINIDILLSDICILFNTDILLSPIPHLVFFHFLNVMLKWSKNRESESSVATQMWVH